LHYWYLFPVPETKNCHSIYDLCFPVACVLGRVGLLLLFQAGHMPFVTMGNNCFCGAPWLFVWVLYLFFFFFSLNCQNLAWFGYARVQSYSVLFFFWDSDGCCSFVLCFPAMWLTLASCNQMHQLQSIDS
jgi:hypothetical protein